MLGFGPPGFAPNGFTAMIPAGLIAADIMDAVDAPSESMGVGVALPVTIAGVEVDLGLTSSGGLAGIRVPGDRRFTLAKAERNFRVTAPREERAI